MSVTINSFKDLQVSRNTINWVKKQRFNLRLKTAEFRLLPDFLIVGAQKAGTTSLYSYLIQHKNIIKPLVKEIHYFDGGLDPEIDAYSKGEKWYRAFFPFKFQIENHELTFDASPLYLFNPLCPQRIHQLLPNVKLIVLLRNPVDRAISHYYHQVFKGREYLNIESGFSIEDQRIQYAIESEDFKNHDFIHFSYKRRGLYAQQLKRYLDYFPLDQMLIINSESLFQDPMKTVIEVSKFLGVSTSDIHNINFKAKNVGRVKKNVPSGLIDELNQFYKKPNEELFEIIGQRFNW